MDEERRQSLLVEQAALERRLREIQDELNAVPPVEMMKKSPAVDKYDWFLQGGDEARRADGSLREIVIDMLSEVNHFLTNTMIRHLYEARFQKPLLGSRLGTLSHDEMMGRDKWHTTVYGLTHPIQLVEEDIVMVKNIWARSDWKINQRVYIPIYERLIQLKFLDWYFRVFGERKNKYLKSPVLVRYAEGLLTSLKIDVHDEGRFSVLRARVALVKEIEKEIAKEQTEYRNLIMKTLSVHRRNKLSLDPILDAPTDLGA